MAIQGGLTMREQLMEQAASAGAAASVAGKASIFTGAGTAVYGLVTSEYFFAAAGTLCAFLTFAVNSYFTRKKHKLEQRRAAFEEEMARAREARKLEEARVRMEVMRASGQVVVSMPDTTPGVLVSRFTQEEGA